MVLSVAVAVASNQVLNNGVWNWWWGALAVALTAVSTLVTYLLTSQRLPAAAASPEQPTEPGGGRRAYSGDHIEFHHNTFGGVVIGKQVPGPTPPTPASGDGDSSDGE
ncbi:hypothetical protein ACQP2K_17350 [Microbispora siamensis]